MMIHFLVFVVVFVLFSCLDHVTVAFSTTIRTRRKTTTTTVVLQQSSFNPSSDARNLLYQDQQKAMLRRALDEEELLTSKGPVQELKEPTIKLKPQKQKSGTGFGSGSKKTVLLSPQEQLAQEQAKIVHKEGVVRINNVLSMQQVDELREFVLQEQAHAEQITSQYPQLSTQFYGVEQSRTNRCDLHLSLKRGGYVSSFEELRLKSAMDNNNNNNRHPVVDTLQELLGENGTLRYLYENLVTKEGELYELASVITNPGSDRQIIHPDLPYNEIAPLYVIFLALQDVNVHMGPTTFLLRSQSPKQSEIFASASTEQKDEQIRTSKPRLATIQKGDAILFDARTLHCGNANDPVLGSQRVLFNFSFRNPQVLGNLGYQGSIRPEYSQRFTLGDIQQILSTYDTNDSTKNDPFEKYN